MTVHLSWWPAPHRARSATVTIKVSDPYALDPFEVALYVGEPGQARQVGRGQGPGRVTVRRDFAKDERLSVEYPNGVPGKEAIATVEWEPAN
jgi:hypothetical protein